MRTRTNWGKSETDLMAAWIAANPDKVISHDFENPELLALFPGRTQRSLYAKWRNIKIEQGTWPLPLRRERKTVETKTCDMTMAALVTWDFLGFLDNAINEFISAEVGKRMATEKTRIEKEAISRIMAKLQQTTPAHQ